jgi:hypothetical protein
MNIYGKFSAAKLRSQILISEVMESRVKRRRLNPKDASDSEDEKSPIEYSQRLLD